MRKMKMGKGEMQTCKNRKCTNWKMQIGKC